LLAHLSVHLFWILSGAVTDDRTPTAQFSLPNPVVADTNSVSRYKQESFMDPEAREELFQQLRSHLMNGSEWHPQKFWPVTPLIAKRSTFIGQLNGNGLGKPTRDARLVPVRKDPRSGPVCFCPLIETDQEFQVFRQRYKELGNDPLCDFLN
jgi:hypothetical protein